MRATSGLCNAERLCEFLSLQQSRARQAELTSSRKVIEFVSVAKFASAIILNRFLSNLLSKGEHMRDLPSGSSMHAILVIVLVIVTFFVSAAILMPKGFSSDTTIIGSGSNVAVLAHNKDSVQSLTLIE